MRANGDGTTAIRATVPDPVAARLAAVIEAYTDPRREARMKRHDDPYVLPYPRRAGEGFCEFLEDLAPTRLPIHGGDATTLFVTITLDSLRKDLGTATLLAPGPGDSLDIISADEARRLACRAQIIPAVLGGDGELLDLGRARRLFTPAQRKALLIRDKTCRAEGFETAVAGLLNHRRHPRRLVRSAPLETVVRRRRHRPRQRTTALQSASPSGPWPRPHAATAPRWTGRIPHVGLGTRQPTRHRPARLVLRTTAKVRPALQQTSK